jgi:hypothetical protein
VVLALLAFGLAMAAPVAHADRWHAGLDLRADPGTHPIRTGGGLEHGRLDTMLVLDPMVLTDGQHDADLFATWRLSESGWGVLGGWRTTAIDLAGGHQFQDKLLLGVGAPLPWFGSSIRVRWAFELATVVVKHGADLPTEWISFASGRDFIDLVNFGMFVTIEYASH